MRRMAWMEQSTWLARTRPALPVVLHVFPGLETAARGVAQVEKGGDFERLKAVVRKVLGGPDPAGSPGGERTGRDTG